MLKMLGAIAIVAASGGFAVSIAAIFRKEAILLKGLISAIQTMEWELKYRLTELPELCRLAGAAAGGGIQELFLILAGKLDRREVEDVSAAFLSEVSCREFPESVRRNLKQLGSFLGQYDLDEQLQGLEALRKQCRGQLEQLQADGAQRLRCYQTLTLCAGAALVILFL